jgi:hypothetical protein
MEEYKNTTTIGSLIAQLERYRLKYGGCAIVALEGFDPGSIRLDDAENYDSELYPDAKVLIVS